ncbi:MAG: hypothetical protein ACTHKJ_07825 [Candidatus Nitrosocosmicus sp.]
MGFSSVWQMGSVKIVWKTYMGPILIKKDRQSVDIVFEGLKDIIDDLYSESVKVKHIFLV